MKRTTLNITDCKPGMKIAETLYNNYGAVIVVKDAILDAQALARMEDIGISKIRVYEQAEDEVKANHQEYIQVKYEENVQDIKSILSRVSAGAIVDMSKLRNVTETLSVGTYSNQDMIEVLNQMRNADEYTYTHCINVAFIAMMIGKWMNCDERMNRHLVQAGLLHDIGKCKIRNEILIKPGALTQQEFNEIKKHPLYGYTILQDINTLHQDVALGVLMHHEREDGTGYPTGVKSDQIHLVAKILAVADIFDAMTSERIYRKRQSPFEVFELMQNGSFGKLHPVILNTFIQNMGSYYIGTKVRLSDGQEGEVVFINSRNIAKPIVKVDDTYIDLSGQLNLKIEQLLV